MSYPHFVPKEKSGQFVGFLNDKLSALTFCQPDMTDKM